MKISVRKVLYGFSILLGSFLLGAIVATITALRIYFPVTDDQIEFSLRFGVVFFKILPIAFWSGGLLLSFVTLLLLRISLKFAWCISGAGYFLAGVLGVVIWLLHLKAIPDSF